jgi:aspartyl-tRNA(Asn)/glutamyl-tRNA(Gln) amidotransferase subunit B
LPNELVKKYRSQYGLNEYDASQLCDEKETTVFFESVVGHTNQYKAAANWILGPVRQYLNEKNILLAQLQLEPASLAALIQMVEEGKVNFSVASAKILLLLINEKGSPLEIAERENLLQVSNSDELETWVNDALAAMPDKVSEYKKGKKGLIGLFVGEVKKRSKGKADPRIVTQLLEDKLK